MSDIAGRIAVQVGTHLLHQPQGGRGIFLGGVSGISEMETERGKVVILGGGIAGSGATQIASALGAAGLVFDPNADERKKLAAIGQNGNARQPVKEDNEKAVKELGWKTKYNIEDIIRTAWNSYKK